MTTLKETLINMEMCDLVITRALLIGEEYIIEFGKDKEFSSLERRGN